MPFGAVMNVMDVTEDLSFLGYRIGQQYSYKDGFYGRVGIFGEGG